VEGGRSGRLLFFPFFAFFPFLFSLCLEAGGKGEESAQETNSRHSSRVKKEEREEKKEEGLGEEEGKRGERRRKGETSLPLVCTYLVYTSLVYTWTIVHKYRVRVCICCVRGAGTP
jgi:hypothetical protein